MHAHKTGSTYLLGVLFNISDEHPPSFLYESAPPHDKKKLTGTQHGASRSIVQCFHLYLTTTNSNAVLFIIYFSITTRSISMYRASFNRVS